MELWATLEELFVGNFVEVGYTFRNIYLRNIFGLDDSQQAGGEGSEGNPAL